jgi:hypothetical protein
LWVCHRCRRGGVARIHHSLLELLDLNLNLNSNSNVILEFRNPKATNGAGVRRENESRANRFTGRKAGSRAVVFR